MERKRLEELARRVYADRRMEAERAKRMGLPAVSWYMMNLSHPVVRLLYDNWKAENGMKREAAPGDIERTLFELELLNERALQEVRAYLDRMDYLRAIGEGGQGGKNDF